MGWRTAAGSGLIRVPSEDIAKAVKKKKLPEITRASRDISSGDTRRTPQADSTADSYLEVAPY
jgi:hypothetical protein